MYVVRPLARPVIHARIFIDCLTCTYDPRSPAFGELSDYHFVDTSMGSREDRRAMWGEAPLQVRTGDGGMVESVSQGACAPFVFVLVQRVTAAFTDGGLHPPPSTLHPCTHTTPP